MNNQFFKFCPQCGDKQTYITKGNLNNAIKLNRICAKCRAKNKGLTMMGEANSFFGNSHSDEIKSKIAKTQSDYISKHGHYNKGKINNHGSNNPMFGRSVYSIWLEKYGKEEADKRLSNQKAKTSKATKGENNPMYGKPSPQGSGNGWSGWYKGKFFRSLLELSFIINKLEKYNIKWESAESARFKVSYTNSEGTIRNYFPDFHLIELNILVEIKPKNLWYEKDVVLKRESAMNQFEKNYLYITTDAPQLSFMELNTIFKTGEINFTSKYKAKFEAMLAKQGF